MGADWTESKAPPDLDTEETDRTLVIVTGCIREAVHDHNGMVGVEMHGMPCLSPLARPHQHVDLGEEHGVCCTTSVEPCPPPIFIPPWVEATTITRMAEATAVAAATARRWAAVSVMAALVAILFLIVAVRAAR